MPPRKSNVSVTSNGLEEGTAETPAKQKDGMSVEDLSLPKSMIARLAKGVLPANTQIQKDALLALHKSTTVFVSYFASTANEIASAAGKKTIQPQDVLVALKECELEGFADKLQAELSKYNEVQSEKRNAYRKKVKEDKAASTSKDAGEGNTTIDGETVVEGETVEGANGTANGHVEGGDADRPAKKLKAGDGTALNPDLDAMDEDFPDDTAEVEQDDEHEDDEVEEDEGEDEEDDEVDATNGDMHESKLADSRMPELRDEALDDPGNDSD